ncbi:MAG: DUF2244 domain-containing protein [Alphaproteobacteria bacterium]
MSPLPVSDAGSAPAYLFDALLTPSRSLPRAGFIAVMAGVTLVSVGLGSYFVLHGAWPVFGFFGLDVALLYLAFRLSYRSGRSSEIVRLTPESLLVRRTDSRGKAREWRFNPFWVRVEIDEPESHDARLMLTSHGERLEIAAFLSPAERLDFAGALRAALQGCRRSG